MQKRVEFEVPGVAKPFYRRTRDTLFSSDTFRGMGYDKYVSRHGIGYIFAALKKLGYAEEVGRTRSTIESNHGREIRLYQWTDRAQREWGR